MSVLQDFYELTGFIAETGGWKASLRFNATHSIFAGHFPGQPVVPGICMMQLVQDALEKGTGNRLQLSAAHTIKFLQFIDPRLQETINLDLKLIKTEEDQLTIMAQLFREPVVYFKYNAVYKQIIV